MGTAMHTRSLAAWQHGHAFDQHLRRPGERRVLWVMLLTGSMMVVETAAGVAFGSMALLADGLHMGSHLAALAAAWLAYGYARRHAHDRRFSFGTGKVNALAGYSSAIVLLLVALAMGIESALRLYDPQPIAFTDALVVAALGLAVNGVSAWLLADHDADHHAHDHDHNLHAAYLHVLADMATSVLAIAALLAGLLLGWTWLDAIAGMVGAVVICRWAFGLIGDAGGVLLDRRADDATLERVRRAIEVGHDRVSDLHVWSIGSGGYAAAITVVSAVPMPPTHYRSRIPAAAGIVHATIEVHRCEGHDPHDC